jgi:hypothetical protein
MSLYPFSTVITNILDTVKIFLTSRKMYVEFDELSNDINLI